MLVRFSKYDFWIPGEILDLYRKNSVKKIKTTHVEKVGKYFSRLKRSKNVPMKKSMKNENFACEFGKKSKFFPMKKSMKNENFACEFGKTSNNFPMKKTKK